MHRLVPVLALLATCFAQTETPNLEQQLAANRSDIRVESGKLAGDGAAKLEEPLRRAQYVFLGEDHGISEVAQFADALYTHIQPLGFNTLALEVGPYTAKELNDSLAKPDSQQAHSNFLRAHPMTVPFYNTQEEFDFLKHARELGGSNFKIIGFDQELMGSSKWLLEQVQQQRLTPDLRTAVQKLLADEDKALAQTKQSGRFDQLYMMSANEAALKDLAQRLRAAKLDATPIDNLLASREVYQLYFTSGYQSNVTRSLLMRKYFAAQDGTDPNRKVMLKAGSNHGFRGWNPLRNRDLGNFVAETAEGRGQQGLHILILAGGGDQLAFAGPGKPMQPSAITPNSKDSDLADFLPFINEAAKHDTWSLFDLRPMRPLLRRMKPDPEIERIILGYDFLVIVPKAHPSHEIQ